MHKFYTLIHKNGLFSDKKNSPFLGLINQKKECKWSYFLGFIFGSKNMNKLLFAAS